LEENERKNKKKTFFPNPNPKTKHRNPKTNEKKNPFSVVALKMFDIQEIKKEEKKKRSENDQEKIYRERNLKTGNCRKQGKKKN